MHAKPSMVLLNDAFIPEGEARVSVFDRGFLYGDAVFETLRVYHGRPFRWTQHLGRLLAGLRLLRIQLPISVSDLETRALELIRLNDRLECVLRIQVSRGTGSRGYSPSGAKSPQVVMAVHPAPNLGPARPLTVRLRTCGWRLQSGGVFGSCKSANRLLQVLARAEAEAAGADDALLLNEQNQVTEASGANFFWTQGDRLWTPPLDSGALDGVTRRTVLELAASLGLKAGEKPLAFSGLKQVEAAFLTSSVQEIVRVGQIDGRNLAASPVADQLHRAYREQARKECH